MVAALYGSIVLTGCSVEDYSVVSSTTKSIVILYENDVHCNINGYSKLAGLRDAINEIDGVPWVVVPDCD